MISNCTGILRIFICSCFWLLNYGQPSTSVENDESVILINSSGAFLLLFSLRRAFPYHPIYAFICRLNVTEKRGEFFAIERCPPQYVFSEVQMFTSTQKYFVSYMHVTAMWSSQSRFPSAWRSIGSEVPGLSASPIIHNRVIHHSPQASGNSQDLPPKCRQRESLAFCGD